MIQVSNLSFAFAEKTIFTRLSFNIERGEILSIIGPNGCGKSTLLRLLRGQLKSYQGEVNWNNIPVESIPAKTMAKQVAVVPQSTHIGFPYKVHEIVAMGRYPHRKSLLSFEDKKDRQAIRQAMAVTDILNLAERSITQLSGGELQRVFLARALAQSAAVLFLDEATSHLDIDHRLELSELLVRLNHEQGTTIVQISHDLDLASAVSKRILLLTEHGDIAAIGTPTEVMTPSNLQRVFRVEVKVEQNPFTGTPQILPLLNMSVHRLDDLKIHLICGGGSGRTLLRKLHLAKAQLSAGPLNRGDSDEEIATAIELPMAREIAFHPFSEQALNKAAELTAEAEILVIATCCWGKGNLACLDLAQTALAAGKPVYLLAPQPEHDFTDGKAWKKIEHLQQQGAATLRNEDQLLEELSRIASVKQSVL